MSTTARKLELGRVGEVVKRVDAIPKVTGEFAYASDLFAAGMLWGHTVAARTPTRGSSSSTSPRRSRWPASRRAHPRRRAGAKTYGLEFPDQPVLAIDKVRYFGEPVALVAAEHPEQARRRARRCESSTSRSSR
jgi:CO/xanthine dehydrogenase Mo-binding subunit